MQGIKVEAIISMLNEGRKGKSDVKIKTFLKFIKKSFKKQKDTFNDI